MDERTRSVYRARQGEAEPVEEAVWAAEGDGGELLPVPAQGEAPARRRRLLPALRGFFAGGDPGQRRAGANVLRFLALMLAATLIARGTAGATMPRVSTATPGRDEIVRSVSANGAVTASGTVGVPAPEGLTVEEMLVSPGQQVEAGDALARFGTEEVANALARAKVELEELRVKLKTQTQNQPRDTTGVPGAQQTLDWAQQDYNTAVAERDAAAGALNAAKAELESKKAAQAALPPEATEEEKQAAQTAVDNAVAGVSQAEGGLATAEQRLTEAGRTVERAKQGLESAKVAAAQADQQAANTAAQNAVEADKTRLDIAEKEKQVAELEALANNEGRLPAPLAGLVERTAEAGGKTAAGTPVAEIIDPGGGFVAEATLPEADAKKLAPGGACQIAPVSDGYSYTPAVEGSILSIGETDAAGNCVVRVRLPEGDWKQGQALRLNMVQNRQSYDLCLPLSAVHTDNAGSFVLRLREETTVLGTENLAERVPVTVLDRDGKSAAVEGPLWIMDDIVTDSSKPLSDGDRVRVNG